MVLLRSPRLDHTLPEKVATAIVEFVYGPLAETPERVGKPLRFDLKGLHSARRGDYRVIYRITDVVTIVAIEHRADVYTGLRRDAELACSAIKMAVTAHGGGDAVNQPGWRTDESKRVIFHTDRGSTYTANSFTLLCRQLGVRQSMGRVGSCSTTPQRRRSSAPWSGRPSHATSSRTPARPRPSSWDWCYGFYNHERRHPSEGMMSPVSYENTAGPDREAA